MNTFHLIPILCYFGTNGSSTEAYVIIPKYSHSNEMVIRNLLKFVSTYNIITIRNNLVKMRISLSAIWKFKIAGLIRVIHIMLFNT